LKEIRVNPDIILDMVENYKIPVSKKRSGEKKEKE